MNPRTVATVTTFITLLICGTFGGAAVTLCSGVLFGATLFWMEAR